MSETRQRGFTLIELIVAMAVAAVLLGVGVPSFLNAIASSRTSADYQEAVGCLLRARSEAVKSGVPTLVCARASDASCGADWSQGCLVFSDFLPRSTAATAVIGPEDTLLSIGRPLRGDNTMRMIGSLTGAASDAGAVAWLRYTRRGNANMQAASAFICDERGPDESRVANVVLTGDIRQGRRPGGSGPDARQAQDVFGRPNGCPEQAP